MNIYTKLKAHRLLHYINGPKISILGVYVIPACFLVEYVEEYKEAIHAERVDVRDISRDELYNIPEIVASSDASLLLFKLIYVLTLLTLEDITLDDLDNEEFSLSTFDKLWLVMYVNPSYFPAYYDRVYSLETKRAHSPAFWSYLGDYAPKYLAILILHHISYCHSVRYLHITTIIQHADVEQLHISDVTKFLMLMDHKPWIIHSEVIQMWLVNMISVDKSYIHQMSAILEVLPLPADHNMYIIQDIIDIYRNLDLLKIALNSHPYIPAQSLGIIIGIIAKFRIPNTSLDISWLYDLDISVLHTFLIFDPNRVESIIVNNKKLQYMQECNVTDPRTLYLLWRNSWIEVYTNISLNVLTILLIEIVIRIRMSDSVLAMFASTIESNMRISIRDERYLKPEGFYLLNNLNRQNTEIFDNIKTSISRDNDIFNQWHIIMLIINEHIYCGNMAYINMLTDSSISTAFVQYSIFPPANEFMKVLYYFLDPMMPAILHMLASRNVIMLPVLNTIFSVSEYATCIIKNVVSKWAEFTPYIKNNIEYMLARIVDADVEPTKAHQYVMLP